MERKLIDIFNCTAKTPINQGLSRMAFQSGLWFSSQPRYDHFDTTPYICRTNELCGKKYYKLSNLKSQEFYPIKLPIASISILFLVAEMLFKKITSLAPVSAAS